MANYITLQFINGEILLLSTSSFLFRYSKLLQSFDIEEDNEIPIICLRSYIIDKNNMCLFDNKTDLSFMFTLASDKFINVCKFLDIICYENEDKKFSKQFIIYVMKNIKVLNDGLQITARKAPASLQREGVYGNFFTDIIRARVGQFTPTGRLLTAGKRIYTRSSNAILKNAILNPESLKDLVKLRTLKKSSAEAAYILGKLNGMIFMDYTQD